MRLFRHLKCATVLAVAASLAACSGIKRQDEVEHSGFLGDIYGQMRVGGENEPSLIYLSPRVEEFMAEADKVLLEPVTILGGHAADEDGPSAEEVQVLANRFYLALHEELAKDYTMVEVPGDNTLRLEVALTKAVPSQVALSVTSKVVPVALVASTAAGMAQEKTLFQGEASLEAKFSDAATGELLAATVDRRVGSDYLNEQTLDSWGDVYEILDFWAVRMRVKFCEARGETDCD